MGKYIIELDEDPNNIRLMQLKNGEDGVPITKFKGIYPYKEPDIEQVKADAYNDGYKYGKHDAWEAAKKIWKYDKTTLKAIFGERVMRMDWFMMNLTASEAIEKLKAYEQEQEIKIGNEVETVKDGVRYTVLSAVNDVYHVLGDNGKIYIYTGRNKLRKTGRHFPEIAAVLKKMKEE